MKRKLLLNLACYLTVKKYNSILFLIVLITIGFSQNMTAQCSIVTPGIINSSTLACHVSEGLIGCDNGTFDLGNGSDKTVIYMDAELDLRCLGVIRLTVKENSSFDFSPGNNKLLLAEGSTLIFKPGSGLIGGSCNASERIYIGSNLLASCNGNAGADFSFNQLLEYGGSGSLASNGPVCVGSEITLTATPPPTASGTFTYSFSGPGLPATTYSSSPIIKFTTTSTTSGLYQVKMKNSNIVNPMIAEITVNLKQLPPTPIITADGSTTFCEGGSVILTSSTGTSYLWSNGATTQSISSIVSGDYTVQVTNASNNCLSASSTATAVIVNPNLPASVSIGASQSGVICSGNLVTFTATPLNGGTTPSYQWKLNGLTVENNSATYSNASLVNGDKVACVLTSNATCVIGSPATSADIAMIVNPNLPVSVSIDVSPSGTICLGTSVTFTATPTNGGTSPVYQWKLNGLNVGTNSATYSSSSLKDDDVVTCTMTSNETCVISNPVESGIIKMDVITTPVSPSVPSTMSLVCAPTTGFLANWTSSVDATRYYLDVATDANFTTILPSYNNIDLGDVISKNVIGLLSSSSYYARVRAANLCGTSANSNTIAVVLPVTTYNGGVWDNGSPDNSKRAVFASNATITSKLSACSCQVNSGVNVFVGVPNDANANAVLKLEDELKVLGTGTLTFENNASLIQVNDNPLIVNTGNIIYKRVTTPMKNFDFTYWCSPVKDQVLKNLSPNTLSDKYYSYNSNGWVVESVNNKMNPAGKGFIIRVPKPNTLYPNGEYWTGATYAQPVQFVGVPNNGVIRLAAMGAGKSNLIGNPYPSALDAQEFMLENKDLINGPLNIWTHNTAVNSSGSYNPGDYATYDLTGGTVAASGGPVPNGEIAAGQSFFVVSNSGNNFVFNNGMRNTDKVSDSGSNSYFYRLSQFQKTTAVEKNRVWLNLTNADGIFKQLLVGYITGATDGIDNLFDAVSLDANLYADFYSINSGMNLVIQGRALPFVDTDQVPLGYRSAVAGVFSIAIDHTDGALANQNIFIEDKVTGVITNLKNGPYTFTTAIGTFNNRFVMRFKTDNGVVILKPSLHVTGSSTDNSTFVSVKNKQIKVSSLNEDIDKIMVFDLKASLIYMKENVNNNEWVISNHNIKDQILIVKFLLKNGKWITKEIIF